MTLTAPTVQEILDQTNIGCGLHEWLCDDGGMVQVKADDLRMILEQAYNANDIDWLAWVGLDDEGFYLAG